MRRKDGVGAPLALRFSGDSGEAPHARQYLVPLVHGFAPRQPAGAGQYPGRRATVEPDAGSFHPAEHPLTLPAACNAAFQDVGGLNAACCVSSHDRW
jgi:hypothetical protein